MIKIYSNGCPKCKVLKQKLEVAKIEFEEISDMDLMISKGFMSMPMLEVDDFEPMDFMSATSWVNNYRKNREV